MRGGGFEILKSQRLEVPPVLLDDFGRMYKLVVDFVRVWETSVTVVFVVMTGRVKVMRVVGRSDMVNLLLVTVLFLPAHLIAASLITVQIVAIDPPH